MKNIFLSFVFTLSLTNINGQDLIYGVENKIIWGKEDTKDVTLPLDFKTNVKPNQILIGYNSPNGTKFYVTFKNLGVFVDLLNIISMENGLNEYGDCNEGYYIEVAAHDFDDDKNPEIIIAVGNGLFDMWINVIKYYPPLNPEDAIRTENWTLVASFYGQNEIHIDKQVIHVPIGTQGLFTEYTWVNGKFIKTN